MRGPFHDQSSPRGLIMLAVIAWVLLYPVMHTAGDDLQIGDPKSWADDFARLVATRNMDQIIDALAAATMGKRVPEFFKIHLAQVSEILARSGEISSIDSIAEREWGKSVVMYWYYLDFKNGVVVISVRLGKHGSDWHIDQFNFTTEIDDAKLP